MRYDQGGQLNRRGQTKPNFEFDAALNMVSSVGAAQLSPARGGLGTCRNLKAPTARGVFSATVILLAFQGTGNPVHCKLLLPRRRYGSLPNHAVLISGQEISDVELYPNHAFHEY
jgi:hypothetical protein